MRKRAAATGSFTAAAAVAAAEAPAGRAMLEATHASSTSGTGGSLHKRHRVDSGSAVAAAAASGAAPAVAPAVAAIAAAVAAAGTGGGALPRRLFGPLGRRRWGVLAVCALGLTLLLAAHAATAAPAAAAATTGPAATPSIAPLNATATAVPAPKHQRRSAAGGGGGATAGSSHNSASSTTPAAEHDFTKPPSSSPSHSPHKSRITVNGSEFSATTAAHSNNGTTHSGLSAAPLRRRHLLQAAGGVGNCCDRLAGVGFSGGVPLMLVDTRNGAKIESKDVRVYATVCTCRSGHLVRQHGQAAVLLLCSRA